MIIDRGGDFHARQKIGERPKQLNYSRAFGGKDLKMFGLSVEPDIKHLAIRPCDRLVLLGSDGLFDVMTAFEASYIAIEVRARSICALPRLAAVDLCSHFFETAIFVFCSYFSLSSDSFVR